ncbi:hypothetical protein DMP23_43060 [Amycolatopsis sp. A1MSW2902]|uniref:hypothetical protein n=1 Tax=Amycolatopsis sp. A1MSW2902 TaxID=687413 RepID=UPI00307DF3B7
MTDDQLRMVVRAFGWSSPWDAADGTPEAEVRRRYPFLAGLHWGWRTAFDSDCAGSDALTGYVEQSPATEAVRGQYESTLAEWLAGSFGRSA